MARKQSPSVISGALRQPFAEQVAFFRNKLGNLVPTAKWDDITRSAHDRSFMVAGATKADLLTDLAAAVDRATSEGKSISAFRKDFAAIVKKHGWTGWTGSGSKKGIAWRTRIIYTTNAATAYAAGRYAQLQEGNYPYWVYHHNDSVSHPRPLHQAWNGLVLPADALWWNTHYPPNGWGCRCYISGARSKAGARRLGGNPGKQPDPSWNKTDAKTGAPVGIDKGWDYAPGSTVSETVQQMAKKTQQWEYTLAKAYMQSPPISLRDNLARAYRELPSVADDARRYAQAVLDGRKVPPYRTLGLLTSSDAAQLAKMKDGLAVTGFDYALDAFAPKHVLENHGDVKVEAKRGQRAVIAADYAKLPLILSAPDRVENGGVARTGLQVLRYLKEINGELYTAVFDVRKGRKSLALQTLYVRRVKKH